MARIRQNNQSGTLTSTLTAGATSWTEADFAALAAVSAPDILAITIDPDGTPEIVHVTSHATSSTTVTILRGQEGTTGVEHLSGVTWVHGPTALDFSSLEDEIDARTADSVFDADTYGADPDGVADSTTAIGNALSAANAAGGGTVVLSPGTYLVTGISIPSNVVLAGAGKDATILNLTAPLGTVVSFEGTYSGASSSGHVRHSGLRDVKIDAGGTGIGINCEHASSLRLTDFWITGAILAIRGFGWWDSIVDGDWRIQDGTAGIWLASDNHDGGVNGAVDTNNIRFVGGTLETLTLYEVTITAKGDEGNGTGSLKPNHINFWATKFETGVVQDATRVFLEGVDSVRFDDCVFAYNDFDSGYVTAVNAIEIGFGSVGVVISRPSFTNQNVATIARWVLFSQSDLCTLDHATKWLLNTAPTVAHVAFTGTNRFVDYPVDGQTTGPGWTPGLLTVTGTPTSVRGTLLRSDGQVEMTADLTLSDGYPAASENYVDNAAVGLSWKQAARAASTANVDIATLNNTDTLDGVALATNDRVLLKDQTAPAENGIYVVAAAEGDTDRAADMDAPAEFVGAAVLITEGTANQNTAWTCTVAPAVVDTNTVTFQQFSGGSPVADETSIITSGNTLYRAALTGDVTASQGANATTVARVRGTNWEGTAPNLGEIPVFDGTNITWQPRRSGNEIHLGDERWGLSLDGTNAAANNTAMDAVLAACSEGDTIILPPGANIAVTRPIWFDVQGLSVVTDGAPRQTHNMESHTTARFTAAAAMPYLAVFEGPAERGDEGSDDGNKTFQYCAGVTFDGGNAAGDSGYCTEGIVLVNGRETQFERISVHSPSAGTDRFVTSEDGAGMFPMFSIGRTKTEVTGWTRSGDTLTSASAHGLTDLDLVKIKTLGSLTGVTAGLDYYVIKVSDNAISLADTRADARADTAITLGGAGTSLVIALTNNAQDCNVLSSRAMGGVGPLGATEYPPYTIGFWIKDAADCLLFDTKAVRCDVAFWVTSATCGVINCHPFAGSVSDTISGGNTTYAHAFAGVVVGGPGIRIIGNYFDNFPGYDATDGKGAWIFINTDDAYCTDATIANNVFNNGAGGGDRNPAIRVKGAVGRLVSGLTITGNAFHAKGDTINHSNGTSASMDDAGELTCNPATNIWTTLSTHGLRNGQPIKFTAVTAASNVTAGVVYFVDWESTTTFKLSTRKDLGDTVDVTASDNSWRAEGFRQAIFKGLLTAENWSNLKSVTFTGNTARWVWDPYYDTTTGLGYTDPVRVFWDEANPTAIVWPQAYGNNTYDVGTWGASRDDLATSTANTNNYIDHPRPSLVAFRTTDGTAVNNSTTHVNDSVLAVPVLANTSYILEAYIAYSAAAAADVSLGWTMPSGATISWGPFGPKNTIAADSAQWLARVATGNYEVGAEGTGTIDGCNPRGLVTIGGTAGTFQLKHAQGTADASDATIRAGSWIRLTPVSTKLIQR